jgi:hypothetical protein
MLLPIFNEWIDQHRNIKANEKSPHDARPCALCATPWIIVLKPISIPPR